MTVAELIEILKTMPQDAEVFYPLGYDTQYEPMTPEDAPTLYDDGTVYL